MVTGVKRFLTVVVAAVLVISVFSIINEFDVFAASLKLSKKTAYVAKNKTVKLTVKGTKSKVKWSSKDKKVATVSKRGVVKGKSYGTTTIIAKVKGKKLKCKVTVLTKSQIKARQLRSYILKHGKKNNWENIEVYNEKKSKYEYKQGYAIGYRVESDDRSGETVGRIIAYKDTNALSFLYRVAGDDDWMHCNMHIDFISGKPGSFTYFYDSEANNEDEFDEINGNIWPNYDGTADMLLFLDYQENLYNEEALKGLAVDALNNSFKWYDQVFESKKISSRMNNIGFKNWSA